MGTTQSTLQRVINLKNPAKRLQKEELERLKSAFQAIQGFNVITREQFKSEVNGKQMPERLADKLFDSFRSRNTKMSKDQLNFQDLIHMYATFRYPTPQEKAWLVYEILLDKSNEERKLEPGHADEDTDLPPGFLEKYIKDIMGGSDEDLTKFMLESGLDPSQRTNREDFAQEFEKVMDMPFFNWIYQVFDGYQKPTKNIDPKIDMERQLQRRLTVIQQQREKNFCSNMGFIDEEPNFIFEYFQKKVVEQSANPDLVRKTLERLFQEVRSPLLKQLFMKAIIKRKEYNFQNFITIVFNIVRVNTDKTHLIFLANLLADNLDDGTHLLQQDPEQPFDLERQNSIKNKNVFLTAKMLEDFKTIFKLGPDDIDKNILKDGKVKRHDFVVEALKFIHKIDFSIFKDCKLMLVGTLSMACQDAEEQKQAILKLLDGNTNIQGYIYQHLERQSTYYLVDANFWNQWTANVGFYSEKATFSFDSKPLEFINNERFVEEKHQERLKEMEFETDFVVLPEDVFWALSKWYPTNRYIERRTLQFHQKKLTVKQVRKENEDNTMKLKKKETIAKQVFNFKKYYADIVYELEVFPRFIYFQMIGQDGEKPHLSAILNKRIDPVYIEKECKNQNIPFGERYFSRRTTLKDLLQLLTDQIKNSSSIPNNIEDDQRPYKGLKTQNGRLWDGEELISSQYMNKTLEEYGISDGCFIYIEYLQGSIWPTDKLLRQQAMEEVQSTKHKKGLNKRSVGLKNLGNTCYMNSALQCIANTKFFKDYFAAKAKYFVNDINDEAVLGYHGELAEQFGNLMVQMWNTKKPDIAPSQFKTELDRITQNFEGFEQHDSQEFLAFMLQGLHEDLNLILKKPFVEDPGSKGEDLWRLSLHQQANTLRREYSFIQFLFSGQLLATMTCQECFNRSYKFETFQSISLPLPEPKMKLISIVVQRLPSELKDTLSRKGTRLMQRAQVVKERYNKKSCSNEDRDDDGLSRSIILEEEQKKPISEGQGQPKGPMRIEDLQNSDNQHLGDESFQECFANEFDSLKNDHPLRLTFQIDVEATIAEITDQICQIKQVNIDSSLKNSKVVWILAQNVPGHSNTNFSQQQSFIKGILAPQRKLAQIKGLDETLVIAQEVLTQEGRQSLQKYYLEENQTYLLTNENALLQNLVDKKIKENQFNMYYQMNEKRKELYKRTNNFPRIDPYQSFNKQQNLIQYWESNYLKFPDYIYVVALHRRYLRKKVYFFNPDFYQIFGLPMVLELPLQPSGLEVYQEVWSLAQNVLKLKSSFKNRKNLWWEQEDAMEKVEQASQVGSNFELKPFVLKSVERNTMNCFNCPFEDSCNGCIIAPGDAAMVDFFARGNIIIEWHSSLIEDDYNTGCNKVVEHTESLVDENYHMHLRDCFELFSKEEKLDEFSGVHCSKCKQIQPMYRKMDIYKPPPILVIQLKRFKERNGTYAKIQSPVDFDPQLSLREFIYDESRLKELGVSENYNLFALINHYGTLTFGHYMSVLRCQQTGKQTEWYCYDDNKAYKLSEQQMKDKVSAYILFYVRKDVESMNYFTEVFPALKTSVFQGKPVILRENKKECFIIDWAIEEQNQKDGPSTDMEANPNQIKLFEKQKSRDKVLVYFPDSGTEKIVHKYKDLIHDVNDPNYTEEELKEDLKEKQEEQNKINEFEEQIQKIQKEKEEIERKNKQEQDKEEAIQKAREKALADEVEKARVAALKKAELQETRELEPQAKVGDEDIQQDQEDDIPEESPNKKHAIQELLKLPPKTIIPEVTSDVQLDKKPKIQEPNKKEEPKKEVKEEVKKQEVKAEAKKKENKEVKEKDEEIARLKAELQKAKSESQNPERRKKRKGKKKKNRCCQQLKKLAGGRKNEVCIIF